MKKKTFEIIVTVQVSVNSKTTQIDTKKCVCYCIKKILSDLQTLFKLKDEDSTGSFNCLELREALEGCG